MAMTAPRRNGVAWAAAPPAWAIRCNAAVWLADMMVRSARRLRAGDVLLTGALGPMVAVARRATSSCTHIEGLGERARGVSATNWETST